MLLLNSRVPGSFEGSFDQKRPKFSTKVIQKDWSENSECILRTWNMVTIKVT